MSSTVCEHFNPVDLSCDQCNSETRQTLELELARHANLIRQICNSTYSPRRPLTQYEVVDAFCKKKYPAPFVVAFEQGVRFAEKHHRIGEQT